MKNTLFAAALLLSSTVSSADRLVVPETKQSEFPKVSLNCSALNRVGCLQQLMPQIERMVLACSDAELVAGWQNGKTLCENVAATYAEKSVQLNRMLRKR